MKYLFTAMMIVITITSANAQEQSCQPMLRGRPVGNRLMASDMYGLQRLAKQYNVPQPREDQRAGAMLHESKPVLTCIP